MLRDNVTRRRHRHRSRARARECVRKATRPPDGILSEKKKKNVSAEKKHNIISPASNHRPDVRSQDAETHYRGTILLLYTRFNGPGGTSRVRARGWSVSIDKPPAGRIVHGRPTDHPPVGVGAGFTVRFVFVLIYDADAPDQPSEDSAAASSTAAVARRRVGRNQSRRRIL